MSLPASLLDALEHLASEALPAVEQIVLSLVGEPPGNARIRAEALAAHAALHAADKVISTGIAKAISALPQAR